MLVVAASSLGSVLRAQDINIRVLDGRNGHSVGSNLCLNVSIGTWHGADLLAPTNKDGIVVLHVGEGKVSAEVPLGTRCVGGFPTRAVRPQGEDKFTPASGGNDCQPFHKHQKYTPLSYSMQAILQHGVVAENVCGKPSVEAKPGELIFFVRSPGLLDHLKNNPTEGGGSR